MVHDYEEVDCKENLRREFATNQVAHANKCAEEVYPDCQHALTAIAHPVDHYADAYSHKHTIKRVGKAQEENVRTA